MDNTERLKAIKEMMNAYLTEMLAESRAWREKIDAEMNTIRAETKDIEAKTGAV
jgi:hypothetical protein